MSDITATINNSKKRKYNAPSSVSSVVSYAPSLSTPSSGSIASGSTSNSMDNYWLPPISSLLSDINSNSTLIDSKSSFPTPLFSPQVPQQHVIVPNTNKKKRKDISTTQKTTKASKQKITTKQKPLVKNQVVFMPMIPYYFHHEKFGIEACMLQLEGQKKFNNYYYI